MSIRRVLIYAALAFSAVAAGWPGVAAAQVCGNPMTATLIAGQHIDAGSVTVWNDENGTLYVHYGTTGEWRLAETHLAVADSLAGIPQKNGNPIPGQFPYKRAYDPPVMEDIYVLPGYSVGDSLFIAAHAVVVQPGGAGAVLANETAWGGGPGFPGKNWAMYFTYTVQACPPPSDTGCTLTQGYWKTHSKYGPAPYDETWNGLEDATFFLSGQTYYEVLHTSVAGGNAYYQLAHQWIAAKLNGLNGASVPSEVGAAMDEAEGLLAMYTPDGTLPNAVRGRFTALAELLDAYNNGEFGPAHCE